MRKDRVGFLSLIVTVSALSLGFAGDRSPATGVSGRVLAGELAAAARTAGALEVSKLLLTADLGKWADGPLTESGAVALLHRAGVTASTTNPDRVLTRGRADSLMREFSTSLAAHGKAGASNHSGVPAEVETCFQEKNHGLCVDCCKELGGSASSCAKACFVINKPSADEPLP